MNAGPVTTPQVAQGKGTIAAADAVTGSCGGVIYLQQLSRLK